MSEEIKASEQAIRCADRIMSCFIKHAGYPSVGLANTIAKFVQLELDQRASELEALQNEVLRLKNVVIECESYADAQGKEAFELLNAEADKEHARAVELCDKLIEERRQNQELREALVLARQFINGDSPSVKVYETIDKALALKP